MTRVHNQAAEQYADKMSSMMGVHQLELQSVHTQLSSKLKSKEQTDQQEIQAWETRLASVAAAARVSPNTPSNGANGNMEQLVKLMADLKDLQVRLTQSKRNTSDADLLMTTG